MGTDGHRGIGPPDGRDETDSRSDEILEARSGTPDPLIPVVRADGRDAQTFEIIGAAMEVHGVLGPGFLEPAYQDALSIEFAERGVKFAREVPLPIHYKGRQLACTYKADFICYDEVIVELKALDRLGTREQAQLINYLKATKLRRGLLLNFGAARLEHKRMVV